MDQDKVKTNEPDPEEEPQSVARPAPEPASDDIDNQDHQDDYIRDLPPQDELEANIFADDYLPADDAADTSKGVAEEECEELLKEVVAHNLGPAIPTTESLHDPECPLHEAEASGTGWTNPCPPGVKRCCTCCTCPLDDDGTELKADMAGDVRDGDDRGSDDRGSDGRGGGTDGKGGAGGGADADGHGGAADGYGGYGSEYWSELDRLRQLWAAAGQKGFGEEGRGFDYSPPMSDRTRYEGSVVDYMKFFIEPVEVCYKTLSSLSSSYVSCDETGLQRTIVIVKPQAVRYKETINRVIFEAGFQVLGTRVLHLTPEQVSEIYSKYYGSPSFAHLVVSVSDAPVLAICISALNVVKRWLNIIGPDGCMRAEWFYPLSMRKLFGLQDTRADWIHGSENLKAAHKEARYFYPESVLEPLVSEEEKVWDYCTLNVNKAIVDACTELVKRRPADPIIFFADYLLLHNPFQPRLPRYIAMTQT